MAEERVAQLCRLLDHADEPPTLEGLAAMVGLSRFHLQRRFKALTGVSPRTYVAARRAERLGHALRSGVSVTEAVYQAGYGSSAASSREADRWLGMPPSVYRSGGAGMSVRFVAAPCSLGKVLVAATERGVCAILLGDDPQELIADLQRRFPAASHAPGGQEMAQLVAAVVALIEDPARQGGGLPLDLRGTAFQIRVWQALAKIPAGRTVSYAELAAAVGAPRAARAVARACATNHLAVAVPCHRVIRGDGDLSGYRWGIERKRALLARERG